MVCAVIVTVIALFRTLTFAITARRAFARLAGVRANPSVSFGLGRAFERAILTATVPALGRILSIVTGLVTSDDSVPTSRSNTPYTNERTGPTGLRATGYRTAIPRSFVAVVAVFGPASLLVAARLLRYAFFTRNRTDKARFNGLTVRRASVSAVGVSVVTGFTRALFAVAAHDVRRRIRRRRITCAASPAFTNDNPLIGILSCTAGRVATANR